MRSRTNRFLIIVILFLCGCGTSSRLTSLSTLDRLRSLSRNKPTDPQIQRDLAIAEMFFVGGAQDRVLPQINRALALDKDNLRLQFAAALYYDIHGDPERALNHYINAIRSAVRSKDPIAPQLSEVAIRIVQGLEDDVAGYQEKVRSTLDPITAQKALLAAPARHAANDLLIDLAYAKGDVATVERIAKRDGCIREWRVAGPFGPRALLGFDRDYAVQPGTALAEQYDLGPGRGVRKTRDINARGCNTHLGNGPVMLEGTSWAQARLDIPNDDTYLVRFETPNTAEIYVDGQSIERVDFRKRQTATTHYLPIQLRAGEHVISVKLTTLHTNPVLSVAVVPKTQRDINAIALPDTNRSPRDFDNGFIRYLTAATLIVRGDIIAARETLRTVDDYKRSSPVLLLQRAGIALSDPLVPSDQRRDDARRLFIASIKRDQGLWGPELQLARIEADNGRVTEAIERLRKAVKQWPAVVAIDLYLIDLLRDREWHSEADQLVRKIREVLPDSCKTLQAELDASRRRRHEQETARIADEMVACDARSNARFATLIGQRRWKEAQIELERLGSLEPNPDGYGILLAQLSLAKNRDDEQKTNETLERLRLHFPRSETALIERVDQLVSRQQQRQASTLLEDAFRREPASTLALRRMAAVVTGEDVLAQYRVDGAKVIADFEASGRSYDQPQVLVFDYMVVRVFEDGSALELVHNIFRVQSDEAVDELGEVRVPETARLLKAQTIKADKRRIEPDRITGKHTISLPDILPGDYTEYEYVQAVDPPNGFPGGFLGDRFYFRSFEIPFDRSHLIVILPRDMPVTVDPRGDAPPMEETIRDNLKVLSWEVQASRPLVAEPLSVSEREYIPSINYGVKATWEDFVESIRDALIDRDSVDPAVSRLVQRIVGEAKPDERLIRAKRLYEWVVRNIENSSDTFSEAAVMLRARRGNRARILHYLLKTAQVPSHLALVRNAANDTTVSELADTNTYDNLLLLVGSPSAKAGDGALWLSTVDRWAPFGYIPPLLRGQRALLLEPGAKFVKVRATRPGEDRHRIHFDIRLRRDGSAAVKVIEVLKGAGANAWRENLEGIAEAELEKRFEEEYVTQLVPGSILRSLRIIGRENTELAFQLEYSFEVGNFGRSVGKGWALPGIVLSQLSTAYARVSNRKTTEIVTPAIDRDITVQVHVPKGTLLPRLPEVTTISGPDHASFKVRNRALKDQLIIDRQLKLPMMRVEPKRYAEFKEFCRNVDLAEASEVVFKMP